MKKTKKKFDAFKDYDEAFTPEKPTNQLTNKPSDKATAAQLMEQYRVAVAADVAAARQKLKFGAMLALWANYLGESRGRGKDGEGLKGWLAENCPEIAYTAAMNYKYKAEKAAEMLGGGTRAMASLLSLCNDEQGDALQIEAPGDVIELTEKERDAAIKLCENVESLGQLEQMYFDFMAKEEKAAKRKARKEKDGVSAHKEVAKAKLAAANGKVLSAADSAAILWGDAMAVFETNRGAFFSAARDLNVNLAEGWLEELKMLVDALKKRVAQR